MASDVLDKVRKLLALAESDNVHEAAAAAARAQSLIEAHRLEGILAAEAAAADDPIEELVLETSKRLRRWKTVLAGGLADVNGCMSFTRESGRVKELVVLGRAADRSAVGALFSGLVRKLEWLSATHGPSAGHDKRWHDDFRVGAAQIVVERLQAATVAQREALSTAALVRVEPALAARKAQVQAHADQRMRLRPGRKISVDPDAWRSGRAAGRGLELE